MAEEYISRKAVRDAIAALSIERFELTPAYRLYVEALDNVDKKIVKIPAADVEAVVRCKDCIHLSGISSGGVFFRCDRYDKWQDESNRVYMPLNGFCCYGQLEGKDG